ncbi:MAG: GxxExxY protein [Crocinitomicaceae bacterium]|nr:MAG: GxxExxY protein [Crocinitomicaceae bacterium]
MNKKSKLYYKELIYRVNGAAIEVHRELGPGLLESVYQKCIQIELKDWDIQFVSQASIPVVYKNKFVDANLRCDLFVEDALIVELKAVDQILPIHAAQVITYMKLLQSPIGLILNFNCTNLYKEGQKTYVNELYRQLE